MTPIFVVTNVAVGAGVFRHMLGAYRRKGIVLTPKSSLMNSRLTVVTSRLPPFGLVVTVLMTFGKETAFEKLQSTVVLKMKKFDEQVLSRKHPTVVLRSSNWWWCVTFDTRHSGSDTILRVMNTASRLPVAANSTTLLI